METEKWKAELHVLETACFLKIDTHMIQTQATHTYIHIHILIIDVIEWKASAPQRNSKNR